MICVFKTGQHIRRSPLSYQALASLFADDITFVDDPKKADLYLFAHSLDIEDPPLDMIIDWRQRRRPIVLLSEEPFWDTIWTKRPLEQNIYISTPWGEVPVVQLSHCTSDIFKFDRIPYYLLTNPRFCKAYKYRFARNASLSGRDWKTHFNSVASRSALMFERRPEPFHNVVWKEADVTGLCAWRTDVAEYAQKFGMECLGHSWTGDVVRRQSLRNWHLDKLMRLDQRYGTLVAFENTHVPDYVTEKFFDAMACGARPVYWASPNHRIHDYGLAPVSWLNTYQNTPYAAAEKIRQPFVDTAFLDAFHDAQKHLATLFRDQWVISQERDRLRHNILAAFEQILSAEQGALQSLRPKQS